MGTPMAYTYALVASILLFFAVKLGEAFVPTAAASCAPGSNRAGSRSYLSAVHPERSAGNNAPPSLTKHPTPPVVSSMDHILTEISVCRNALIMYDIHHVTTRACF